MLSPVIDNRIKMLESCADELGIVIKEHGWTAYALNLVAKMQKIAYLLDLDDEDDSFSEKVRLDAGNMYDAFKGVIGGKWVTTKSGNRIHIGDDGTPDKGNPHVLEAIEESLGTVKARKRKDGMKCESTVEFKKSGSVTRDSMNRVVTHFNHDENVMKITRQIRVEDVIGNRYKICREPIEHLTVFASSEIGRGVDVAEKLSEQVGGDKSKWKHVKGIGTVVDKNGKKTKADIHWFENPESGQILWKIKQFLEDMDESQVYWEK